MVLEIEDPGKYQKASSSSAYFGLYPEFKESGDGNSNPRISKKGRSSCRAILYMAAANVVIHNPYFKDYYARQRSKGLAHHAAIGVVMNRLMRVAWGMLKSQTKFDPKVDQDNQAKFAEHVPKPHKSQSLEISQGAPISRRTRRKLLAEKGPKDSLSESSARSPSSALEQT